MCVLFPYKKNIKGNSNATKCDYQYMTSKDRAKEKITQSVEVINGLNTLKQSHESCSVKVKDLFSDF